MPWNWSPRSRQSVDVGGAKGTYADASNVSTWPNYEAAYLAKRLGGQEPATAYEDRYKYGRDGQNLTDATARAVYLDKVATNFRSEADECLKAEFMDWLQGNHEDNERKATFPNRPGQAQRRAIFPTRDGTAVKQAGETLDNWQATWWGKNQLTHLDGVREFLREKKVKAEEHEFAMNLLAEFGPNNIDQAWTYFKHWVKGQPVKPEDCVHAPGNSDEVKRSGPISMHDSRNTLLSPPTETERARMQDDADMAYADAQQATARAATAAEAANIAYATEDGPAPDDMPQFPENADPGPAANDADEAMDDAVAKIAGFKRKAADVIDGDIKFNKHARATQYQNVARGLKRGLLVSNQRNQAEKDRMERIRDLHVNEQYQYERRAAAREAQEAAQPLSDELREALRRVKLDRRAPLPRAYDAEVDETPLPESDESLTTDDEIELSPLITDSPLSANLRAAVERARG